VLAGIGIEWDLPLRPEQYSSLVVWWVYELHWVVLSTWASSLVVRQHAAQLAAMTISAQRTCCVHEPGHHHRTCRLTADLHHWTGHRPQSIGNATAAAAMPQLGLASLPVTLLTTKQ
jgi:hypothetical protein